MKKTIFRKLYQDTLSFFVTFLFVMGIIVWTIQAVNYFDFVTEDGHGLKVYFSYTILNFPKIIDRVFPFIFFISVFYTISNYEKNNELNLFWLNGISKIYFLNRLILFSIILMMIQIILSSYVSPLSQLKARNYLKNSNIDFFTSLIKPGKFINIAKNITIFIDKENSDGSYSNIFLEDLRNKSSKMIYANKGNIINQESMKSFVLLNGEIVNYDKDEIKVFKFDEIQINFNNLTSKTITVPKIQERGTLNLLNCMLGNQELVKNFTCDDGVIVEMKRELFKRLYKPFYLPIITLICCFLIINRKKDINNNKYKILTFISIILILLFSEASSRYIETSEFLNYLTLSMPLILFITMYYYFYRSVKYV